jgi:hypothetical protein
MLMYDTSNALENLKRDEARKESCKASTEVGHHRCASQIKIPDLTHERRRHGFVLIHLYIIRFVKVSRVK